MQLLRLGLLTLTNPIWSSPISSNEMWKGLKHWSACTSYHTGCCRLKVLVNWQVQDRKIGWVSCYAYHLIAINHGAHNNSQRIFDGSRFTVNRRMTLEYATGDAQKGPVLLESPLKGMMSNSKLHHTIMLWIPGEGNSEWHEKESQEAQDAETWRPDKLTTDFDNGHLTDPWSSVTQVRPNETFSHFVRRNGNNQTGLDKVGMHRSDYFPKCENFKTST